MHGKGFKGNSSRKILEKAQELAIDTGLPRDLKHFAHALEAFKTVVIRSFGKYESKFVLAEIYAFENAYMKLGISGENGKTPLTMDVVDEQGTPKAYEG